MVDWLWCGVYGSNPYGLGDGGKMGRQPFAEACRRVALRDRNAEFSQVDRNEPLVAAGVDT
jgi:hypothetical protein